MACLKGGRQSERSIETARSYVILGAAFCLIFLLSVVLTPAIYYITFYEVFNSTKAMTSWIGSMAFFSMMCIGPLTSWLINRCGFRFVLMAGVLLTSLGLVLTSFATSIIYMCFTYGALTGIGIGLAYTPTASLVGLSFDKHRTLAIGLAALGFGVGMLVYPVIVQALLHKYGWRGSLLILGGIHLHGLPLTLLLSQKQGHKNTRVANEKWNLRIFRLPRYCLLCSGYILTTSCLGTVIFFLPSFATSLGADHGAASFLISEIGISSIIGTLFFSFFGQIERVDTLVVFTFAFLGIGVATAMCPLFTSITALQIFGPVFGFLSSTHATYSTVAIIGTVGVQNLISGIGFVMLACGIGDMIGPPLAGLLFDMTGTYVYSFILVALMDLTGVSFLFATWPRWHKEAPIYRLPDDNTGQSSEPLPQHELSG